MTDSFVIAITGTVASGKSTVMGFLKNSMPNFFFVSSDDIAKEVRANPSIQKLLIDEFGSTDTSIIRAKMTPWSYSLIEVRKMVVERIKEAVREHCFVVVEAPTLFEGCEILGLIDEIIVVDVPDKIRIERMKDRGYAVDQIKAILSSQLSSKTKCAGADEVIMTDCSIEELESKCDMVGGEYERFVHPFSP